MNKTYARCAAADGWKAPIATSRACMEVNLSGGPRGTHAGGGRGKRLGQDDLRAHGAGRGSCPIAGGARAVLPRPRAPRTPCRFTPWTKRAAHRAFSALAQMVFQDPYSSLSPRVCAFGSRADRTAGDPPASGPAADRRDKAARNAANWVGLSTPTCWGAFRMRSQAASASGSRSPAP